MKKENRVRKDKDFEIIISKHQLIRTDEFVIYYNSNNLGYVRVGVTASKKLGNAVTRNRIKRQIRALMQSLLSLDDSTDYIIVAKDKFTSSSFDQNKKRISECLKQIKDKLNEKENSK